ncbi:unnamed protein product [Ilex paraguariensis]|uniref:Uncharacterized protein n=1 Tax=Ilex paraguariensis TaxID=185542 RepID=A0ABC8SLX2_9AQUA
MVGGDDAGVQVHDAEDVADTDVNMADTGMSKSTPVHGVVGHGDTPTSCKHRRKATGETSDGIARSISKMTEILGDYVSSCGKQLSHIAQRVGYEQDATEARHQLNTELAKIDGLMMEHRHRTTYKIASDPIKVDLFMSLPESERPAWLLGVLWDNASVMDN